MGANPPTLRRWVSADPLLAALPGLDEAIGDNLNLYAYAGNNPVARIDQTGFEGEPVESAKGLATKIWSAGRQMYGAAKNVASSAAATVEKEANKPRSIGAGKTITPATHVKQTVNETVKNTGVAVAAGALGVKVPQLAVKDNGPNDISMRTAKAAYVAGEGALSLGAGTALSGAGGGGGVKAPGGGGGGGPFDPAAAKRALFLTNEKGLGSPAARASEALARFRQGNLRIPGGLTKEHLLNYRGQAVDAIAKAAARGPQSEAVARAVQEPRIMLIDEIVAAGGVQ